MNENEKLLEELNELLEHVDQVREIVVGLIDEASEKVHQVNSLNFEEDA